MELDKDTEIRHNLDFNNTLPSKAESELIRAFNAVYDNINRKFSLLKDELLKLESLSPTAQQQVINIVDKIAMNKLDERILLTNDGLKVVVGAVAVGGKVTINDNKGNSVTVLTP
jgi:hypothetical protein